ncbi:TNF receptor-associated factor 2-like [Glandiceps talaboti]
MTGYSKCILTEKDVEAKFICCHCDLILKNPIQTYCGHRYCSPCIDDIITRNGNRTALCTPCKEDDVYDSVLKKEETYPDKAIKRELNQLSVHCVNTSCEWKGLYKEYDEEHAPSCPYAYIKCIKHGCSAQFFRKKLTEHLEIECVMRVTNCMHCLTTVTYKELKGHYEECQQFPVTCKYCGKENIARSEIEAHVDAKNGDCPKKRVSCTFKEVGCDVMVAEQQMKEHSKQYIGEHLLLLLHTLIPFLTMIQNMKDDNGVAELQNKLDKQEKQVGGLTSMISNLSTQVTQLQQQISSPSPDSGLSLEGLKETYDKLRSTIAGLTSNHRSIQMKMSNHEGVVAVLSNQLEKEAGNVTKLEHVIAQQNEKIESLERKIKAQDRIIALKDVSLAEQDLRIQSLEMASYDGELVWKISNFRKKRQDAISGKTVSLYSPCFYTSRHGYKMCARIYLNGDGMGKGNHVSLFFVVMKGSSDALLRWPFRQKVTLMWLDQNNRDHVIDAFRPDPTSSSFKRPTHDMNIASGCPLFMPLSQVDSTRHAYVKDDVAFLKVIVDTTDLE